MSTEKQPLILVVDDDPDIRHLIKCHLDTMNCQYVEASDGEVAIEQLVIHKPDLVLLDVMMPEFNGWEICRYVRTHEKYNHVGVIMLTAIGSTVNELTSPIYGADAYMDKPFEFSKLERLIYRVLKEKSASKETLVDDVNA
jgi:DNA-binding response OmpR family regulator